MWLRGEGSDANLTDSSVQGEPDLAVRILASDRY